jgi:hypothetical protein
VERVLREYGIRPSEETSPVRRHSMACPAIPTCGLAISEAERSLPGILDELETELKRLGLSDEKLSVRMTGCPNGCARPYQSDIGLVGRSGDKYTLFVGGHVMGHRLNFQLKDLIPRAEVVPTLLPILERFKAERQNGESFGDYCHRQGAEKLQSLLPTPGEPKGDEAARFAVPITMAADGEVILFTSGPGAAPRWVNGEARPRKAAAPPAPAEAPAARPTPLPRPTAETFYGGQPGEEMRDYTYRYASDSGVRETVVCFYGSDQRAATAGPVDPLRREAVYQGRADPQRLHATRKLSDTYYVGDAGGERRDYRVEYLPDGEVAQTVVFHYDGDVRAADAPTGAALRRQVAYAGRLA